MSMQSRINLSDHQVHVAQQSRREKLRMPDSQHALSPSRKQSVGSTLVYDHLSRQEISQTCSSQQSEELLEYSGHDAHTNIGNTEPVHKCQMVSSDPYNFPSRAELLAVPAKALEFVSKSAGLGQAFSERGFSSQSSVTSTKSGSWGNLSELELLNTAGRGIQGTSPHNGSGTSASNGLGSNFLVGQGVNSSREANMATYLSGSNVQADAMQTLHLMNPSYAGYTDATNAGNLVLVNPSAGGVGQSNAVSQNGQQHQHYIGFPMPPALTQSSLAAQHSTIATMYNPGMGQQNPSSSLFTNRVGNNTYNWNGVNELSFLPSNDVTQITQSLAARLTSMNSGQPSTSDISQYNMRRQSLHEEQASMLQSGVALGLNMDNSQASAGPSQGLSLSLSPQQPPAVQMQYYNMQPDESGMSSCPGLPHVAAEDNGSRGDRLSNKWIGSLSHFRPSRDGLVGTGFQSSMNDGGGSRHVQLESNVPTVVGSGGLLTGSKYLKAAQQLLDEVVSVGRGIKNSSSKHPKLQSWMASSSVIDGSFAKDRSLAETVTTARDGTACATSMPSVASAPEQNTANITELTPQERQDIQMKKAKLMAMLDEVDRRYRQYYNQMQIVATSFESAAGLGAAKTYTALALQTISRHFRCLRDAISGQIRVASRALGEEDPSSQGLGRGETSRLRYVDQQLRQQRALQQLGMMQQHAWRPQRGLPERSVSVLRAWLFEHFLHPYPKDADKLMLARQTGLTRNQVSNWFINARVRLWKPMVEEMYVEETREGEMDGAPSAEKLADGENMNKGPEGANAGAADNNNNNNQGPKQSRADQGNVMDGVAEKQGGGSEMLVQQTRKMAATDSATDSHLFHEKESLRQQGVKKARNGMMMQPQQQESGSMLDVELKSESETRSEDAFEQQENKMNVQVDGGGGGRHSSFTISHNGLLQQQQHADHQSHSLQGGGGGGFGAYHMGSLGRFSQQQQQEGFGPRFAAAAAAAASNGVSLTLGLQHCDGLSLAGAQHQQQQQHHHHHQHQHQFLQQQQQQHHHQQQQQMPLGGRRHDDAAEDYYASINDSSTNSYEASINLQNRKRFATQILHHDFVT